MYMSAENGRRDREKERHTDSEKNRTSRTGQFTCARILSMTVGQVEMRRRLGVLTVVFCAWMEDRLFQQFSFFSTILVPNYEF